MNNLHVGHYKSEMKVEKTLYIIAIFNTVIKRTASTKYQILKVCVSKEINNE